MSNIPSTDSFKGTINEIWKAMKHAYHKCPADEEIGFAAAMAYLHFLIGKSESFNEWFRAKQYVAEQTAAYKRFFGKMDDLEKDNAVLRARNLKLEQLINEPRIINNYMDGFRKVEYQMLEGTVIFYVKGSTAEEVEYYLDEAIKNAQTNKKPKHPLQYTRESMMNFYRKRGFQTR